MRLGELRTLVRLERPAEQSAGALGTSTSGWSLVAEAYARIEPLSGREVLAAKQVDGRTTHRVTIRYRPGVSTTWRVLVPARQESSDRALSIVAVLNEDEADRVLILMAQEVAA